MISIVINLSWLLGQKVIRNYTQHILINGLIILGDKI